MSVGEEKKRMFYGYVVAAAGFGVWFIGWGAYIAGYLFDRFGTYDPAFWLGFGFAAAGVALSCLLTGSRKGSTVDS